MATTDIGRVTPIWRGFYSAAATYELNDIVIDTAGSVWWHKSEELTTGVIPEAGEIWDAVIDMSVFSGLIQAAITTAQTALAAAQEAVAEVTADTKRAETAADNAENSAAAASESAAGVGALAQAAERSAEAAAGSATGAAGSAAAAAGSKSDAEAYAVGTRGGEDVETTDPTYHNNAKYYAEQAASEAEAAAQSAEDAQDVLDSIPEDYSQLSADVGDLKTQLNDAGFFLTVAYDGIWDVGALNSSGQERNTTGWIRTRNYFKVDSDTVHVVLALGNYTNLLFRVIEYSAESTDSFVVNNSIGTNTGLGPRDISITEGNYIRISVGPSSGSSDIVDADDGTTLVPDMSYDTTLDLTTDKTLTLPDRPADAKATGKAVAMPFVDKLYAEWQPGRISATGNNSQSTSTVYIRTGYRYKIESAENRLTVPEGVTVEIYSYDSQYGAFIAQIGTYTADSDVTLTPGVYIRMVAYHTDLSDTPLTVGYDVILSHKVSAVEFYDELKNQRLCDYSSMAMFETIGIVGDSWASGSIHTPNGFVDTVYAMSWGQILARKMGITVTNYSKGGLTTGAWLTNTENGLSVLLADTAKNAYLLNLGINDATAIRQGTETLGTIADVNISDFTQNPDTFYGNYGRIIGNIKAHAPKAVIIMLSVARPGERNMDEHIKAIAEKYEIPYIDLEDDPYFVSGYFFGSIYDGHMSAYGYSGMANAIERLIQKYIIENRSRFAYYDGLTS